MSVLLKQAHQSVYVLTQLSGWVESGGKWWEVVGGWRWWKVESGGRWFGFTGSVSKSESLPCGAVPFSLCQAYRTRASESELSQSAGDWSLDEHHEHEDFKEADEMLPI